MNNHDDLQRLLKKEYLLGPDFKKRNQIGIQFFSGNKVSAFYELWGEKEIFRLLIMRPSTNLFTSKFVGKNYLLIMLIVEDDQMVGGFISLQESFLDQLILVFPNLADRSLKELEELWTNFVKEHYSSLSGEDSE